ncbi:hypothetical protein HDU96_005575 [Phlyctochytrium bullatum]|nr:hypothetical protein HDU96_005575 [Phlyctochytrium bullatum]
MASSPNDCTLLKRWLPASFSIEDATPTSCCQPIGPITSIYDVSDNVLGRCRGGRLVAISIVNRTIGRAIPDEIAGLDALEYFYLEGTRLVGTPIPEAVGSMTSLLFLRLQGSDLGGTIPSSLGRLVGLRELGLGRNALTGHIPSSLGALIGLDGIWLDNNQLYGSIPPQLASLPNLKTLDISDNCFVDSSRRATCDAFYARLGAVSVTSSTTSATPSLSVLTSSITTDLTSTSSLSSSSSELVSPTVRVASTASSVSTVASTGDVFQTSLQGPLGATTPATSAAAPLESSAPPQAPVAAIVGGVAGTLAVLALAALIALSIFRKRKAEAHLRKHLDAPGGTPPASLSVHAEPVAEPKPDDFEPAVSNTVVLGAPVNDPEHETAAKGGDVVKKPARAKPRDPGQNLFDVTAPYAYSPSTVGPKNHDFADPRRPIHHRAKKQNDLFNLIVPYSTTRDVKAPEFAVELSSQGRRHDLLNIRTSFSGSDSTMAGSDGGSSASPSPVAPQRVASLSSPVLKPPPDLGVSARTVYRDTSLLRMSAADVGERLQEMGVGPGLVEVLEAHGVDGRRLIALDGTALHRMGIELPGSRDVILVAAAQILGRGSLIGDVGGELETLPEYSSRRA